VDSSFSRELDRFAPVGTNLPNLPLTGSVRLEVDPFPVSGPRRQDAVEVIEGKSASEASLDLRDEEVRVVTRITVAEHDAFPIRRPTRVDGTRPVSELETIRPVSRTDPDIVATRTLRGEGDLLSVRRVFRGPIQSRREEKSSRRPPLIRGWTIDSPEVAIRPGATVVDHASAALGDGYRVCHFSETKSLRSAPSR
jgi:hypothetical protein